MVRGIAGFLKPWYHKSCQINGGCSLEIPVLPPASDSSPAGDTSDCYGSVVQMEERATVNRESVVRIHPEPLARERKILSPGLRVLFRSVGQPFGYG